MKKPKKGKNEKNAYLVWILIGSIVGVIILASAMGHVKKTRKQEDERATTYARSLIMIEAQASSSMDKWWARTTPPATLETYQLLERKKTEILEILHKYRGVSDETEKIAARFRDFRIAILIDGKVRSLNVDGVNSPLKEGDIEICFVPEETVKRSLQYSIFWMPLGNVMLIPAVEFPEKFFASILFHELGHAIRHNKHDHGIMADKSTERGVLMEEVEMHQLGAEVLNVSCSGSYYTRIDEILRRHPKTNRLSVVLNSITSEDVRVFDAMIGCSGTEGPSKMLASNYILILGFRFCEARGLGMDGKIDVYRRQ